MHCKTCYTNRIQRDGGVLGLCWQHAKARCRICGEPSAGKHYCAACEHQGDIERWKKESQATHFDDDHEFHQVRLRKERLSESKYHAHRAIEVFFRAMVLALEAIWGDVEHKPEKTNAPELQKAA